mmetsp:Transcript_22866/g.51070  ORF Transcript_22866/g.51070 Transcript_22866/m.51070 type:complete len:222 (+) Transcript_22866:673-1338(+)
MAPISFMKPVFSITNLPHHIFSLSPKRAVSSQDDIQNYTYAPHVATNVVGGAMLHNLGCDVSLCSTLRPKRIWKHNCLRIPKIADLDVGMTVRFQEKAFWSQISVCNLLFVTIGHAHEQISNHFFGIEFRVIVFLDDSINQISSLHAFQHQEGIIWFVEDVKQLDNMFAIRHFLQSCNLIVQSNRITWMQIFPVDAFGGIKFFSFLHHDLVYYGKRPNTNL